MVQNLNIILLTASELSTLRVQLRSMATDGDKDLFSELYKWVYHADNYMGNGSVLTLSRVQVLVFQSHLHALPVPLGSSVRPCL
jgi:hypothetical protein